VNPRGPNRRSLPVSEQAAEEVADTMFALSTPSRVLILSLLLRGPHSVSQLSAALGMEQSALSHQLRVLREHALVSVAREGRKRVYALYDEHVVTLVEEALRHVEQGRRRRRAVRSIAARRTLR